MVTKVLDTSLLSYLPLKGLHLGTSGMIWSCEPWEKKIDLSLDAHMNGHHRIKDLVESWKTFVHQILFHYYDRLTSHISYTKRRDLFFSLCGKICTH